MSLSLQPAPQLAATVSGGLRTPGEWIVSIALLLVSLQSMYFYSLGISPYVVSGAVMSVALCFTLGSHGKSRQINAFTNCVIIIFATEIPFVLSSSDGSEFTRMGALVLILLFILALPHYVRGSRAENVVRFLLAIHVSVLLLQWTLFFGLGIDVDPVGALSEQVQSGRGGTLNHEVLGAFARLGGLFNEPGTFATYIAPLLVIFLKFANRTGRDPILVALTLLGLVLTFSVYAWIFVAMILVALVIQNPKWLIVVVAAAPFVAALAWPYIEYRFFNTSRVHYDDGTGFRIYNFELLMYYINDSWKSTLFGNGFLDPPEVPTLGAFSDTGFMLTTLFYFGYIRSLVFFLMIYTSARTLGYWAVPFLAIILISKANITAPLFWMILILPLLLQSMAIRSSRGRSRLTGAAC